MPTSGACPVSSGRASSCDSASTSPSNGSRAGSGRTLRGGARRNGQESSRALERHRWFLQNPSMELLRRTLPRIYAQLAASRRSVIARAEKWGNSLGFILPDEVVHRYDIRNGDFLEVEIRRKLPRPQDLSGTWKVPTGSPRSDP